MSVYLIASFRFQASTSLTRLDADVQTVQGSLQSSHLLLRPVEETTQVHNPTPLQLKFRQGIRYFDHAIALETGMIPSTDVSVKRNQYGDYVIIPVAPYIRRQLDIIEEFVTLNMDIPTPLDEVWRARDDKDTPYKKIWEGERLSLPLSHWCSYYRKDGEQITPIRCEELAEGTWNIRFTISGLYYGHHKDNKLASIAMHTQSILYIPKQPDVNNIIDQILNESGGKHKSEKNVAGKRKSNKENR